MTIIAIGMFQLKTEYSFRCIIGIECLLSNNPDMTSIRKIKESSITKNYLSIISAFN